MDFTRRRFLTQIGAAGGVSLVHEAMTGLGLLAAPAQQRPFDLTERPLLGRPAANEVGDVRPRQRICRRR